MALKLNLDHECTLDRAPSRFVSRSSPQLELFMECCDVRCHSLGQLLLPLWDQFWALLGELPLPILVLALLIA